ncbi:hypothetical protein, partial [Rathayibacter tritici]|uniref:hypothetical protein n=1 Tax=Rathayibacter tritici TaxID=33888 RepID=UPI001CA553C7
MLTGLASLPPAQADNVITSRTTVEVTGIRPRSPRVRIAEPLDHPLLRLRALFIRSDSGVSFRGIGFPFGRIEVPKLAIFGT